MQQNNDQPRNCHFGIHLSLLVEVQHHRTNRKIHCILTKINPNDQVMKDDKVRYTAKTFKSRIYDYETREARRATGACASIEKGEAVPIHPWETPTMTAFREGTALCPEATRRLRRSNLRRKIWSNSRSKSRINPRSDRASCRAPPPPGRRTTKQA